MIEDYVLLIGAILIAAGMMAYGLCNLGPRPHD